VAEGGVADGAGDVGEGEATHPAAKTAVEKTIASRMMLVLVIVTNSLPPSMISDGACAMVSDNSLDPPRRSSTDEIRGLSSPCPAQDSLASAGREEINQ
jgi:hypothetical protein